MKILQIFVIMLFVAGCAVDVGPCEVKPNAPDVGDFSLEELKKLPPGGEVKCPF
tara:strand:+ start:822 stop:983 length:162 start_codon:yes stop_codon:yes gene_type:complete